MNTIILNGCRSKPIGSYLKALGVLRLVGEQLDPQVAGYWIGDTFRLDTAVGEDDLVDFFLHSYAPTPLVSPWNGGSGYSPKDKAAIAAIESILSTESDRFARYRETIAVARVLVADPSWEGAGKNTKLDQIARCRASFPDGAVEWIDASVVLTDDRAAFPPLFGTGGNDGRLEFSSNYMQRLVELFVDLDRRGSLDTAGLLRWALFDDAAGKLPKGTTGQYDPSSLDPAVTSTSAQSAGLSNPWDYVLLIEGGLLFAAGSARRFGTSSSTRAAMPFCVDSAGVGYGSSADAEDARGEIWAPLWQRPTTLGEISRLTNEGRATWGRKQVATGTDFAKAVATLGVDRGIDRFVRHGIFQRNGLAYFAVPIGEMVVGTHPEVNVLRQVDAWLGRLPHSLPAAATAARRRVEAAEYRAAADPSRSIATALQDVLIELASLEEAIAKSTKRSDITVPVGARGTRLSSDDWLGLLDDATVEFRIAVALASARDRFPFGEPDTTLRTSSSLAVLLRPICLDARGSIQWSSGPAVVPGAQKRPLAAVLADALVARSVRLGRRSPDPAGDSDHERPGVDLGFETGIAAWLDDLCALSDGRVDLDRVARLLRGLLLLDWRRSPGDPATRPPLTRPASIGRPHRVSAAMATLLPFFHGRPITVRDANGSDRSVRLRARVSWAHQLAAGRLDDVLGDAVHRLRMEALQPCVTRVRTSPAERSGALAVASLCRISGPDARRLVYRICPSDSQRRESLDQAIATQ